VSVALALLAAVSYGLADFAGGLSSKRASAWSVALVAQAAGTLVLLAAGLTVGGSPTGTDLAWGVVAGIGNGFGTAFLYRGLSSGRMGVVAPVSGVCAAVLPVVVGVVLGERPALLVWVGIVLALPAIWLVAREPVTPVATGQESPVPSGSLDGILAGVGFGAFFVALAQVDSDAGLLPLTANQLTAMLVIVAVAVSLRQPWVPRERAALGGLVAGVLGASATLCFLLASRDGYLSVTAVLASLYPAFTVLLAAIVLREHVHRAQAAGLALCAVAVVLVVAG
jgi:drug/metabolite transporter (DMT)-like permease